MFLRVSSLVILTLLVGCQSASPPALNPIATSPLPPLAAARSADGLDSRVQQVAYEEIGTGKPGVDEQTADAEFIAEEGPTSETLGSLESIEALAFAVSPAIQRAKARVQALRGKYVQAGLPPNPTAGFLSDDINELGSPGRYGVYFGRQIVRGNKLELSQAVVCSEIEAAEMALYELEQRLRTDVRLRYYDLLIAIEKISIADQLVEFSQDAVDTTEKLVNAREQARTSLLQAKVELQYAQVIRRQASNELAGARRNLAVLIGEEDLPFDTFSGSLNEIDRLDIEAAFERILEQSPEIAKLYSQVEVARRNLTRQCAEPIPNVTWQATVLYGLGSDDVVSGLQVGMPIPILNRNEGAVAQARKEIVSAERNAERTALRLRERLVNAYQAYMDAKLEVDAFNSEILPTSLETVQLVSQGFRQGEVSYLELLVVQRTFFQVNLANIDRLREMWRQRIVIEGMLLSGSLQQP